MTQLSAWIKTSEPELEAFLKNHGVEKIYLKCKEDGEAYVYIPIADDKANFAFYRALTQWLKETHHVTTLLTYVDEEMSRDLGLQPIKAAAKVENTSRIGNSKNDTPQASLAPTATLFRLSERWP